MAALVVTVSPANGMSEKEGRIAIFPGGSTTSMYPANTAFWVGYGFTADAGAALDLEGSSVGFELDVDGVSIPIRTELQVEPGQPAVRTDIADVPDGLPAGWHDFFGRWYDGGRLVLSSRTTIQFVER